jgi:hypothetical protein
LGVKKAMVEAAKKFMDAIKAQGFSWKEADIGDPEKPHPAGDWLVSLVPQKIVMNFPKGKMVFNSYLLGMSGDTGKNWVFLELSNVTNEQLIGLFPELNGNLQYPPRNQPIFKAD